MANLSSYSKKALVNWQRGGNSMPTVSTRYLALFNGDPTSGGSDVTATICTNRLAISSMSTSSGGAKSSTNGSTLNFTSAAGGAGTVTYIAAYDASTSGNLIWYKSVSSRSVAAGNGFAIAASDLTLTADTDISGYAGDRLVNWMHGGNSFPSTTTRYLALFNGDPQSSGVEVTTNIRSAGRVAVTSVLPLANSTAFSTSSANVSFGVAEHANTVSHLAIYDANTSGNLIASHSITGGSHAIPSGYTVYVPAGYLIIAAS